MGEILVDKDTLVGNSIEWQPDVWMLALAELRPYVLGEVRVIAFWDVFQNVLPASSPTSSLSVSALSEYCWREW